MEQTNVDRLHSVGMYWCLNEVSCLIHLFTRPIVEIMNFQTNHYSTLGPIPPLLQLRGSVIKQYEPNYSKAEQMQKSPMIVLMRDECTLGVVTPLPYMSQ